MATDGTRTFSAHIYDVGGNAWTPVYKESFKKHPAVVGYFVNGKNGGFTWHHPASGKFDKKAKDYSVKESVYRLKDVSLI